MTEDDLSKITLFGKRFGQPHAIEAVNFIVRFAVPIDASDNARFDEARERLLDFFPLVEDLQGYQIQFGQTVGLRPQPLKPKVLTEFNRNGTLRWSARFGEENQIIVQSLSYGGWAEDWPLAKERLDALLACVDEYKPIRAVEYAVTDTFIAQTVDQAINPTKLFVENDYVPSHLLANPDPRWDVSHGWFLPQIEGSMNETLVRLDARGVIQNDQTLVNITNLHSFRPPSPLSLKAMGESSNDVSLDKIFDKYHDMNKEFMKEILCKPLLRKMRLLGGE